VSAAALIHFKSRPHRAHPNRLAREKGAGWAKDRRDVATLSRVLENSDADLA
jgi:hypothetical protein